MTVSDTPLVSIIVPSWNRETVILSTIEDILRQTYKNIEIIAVDDGSSDGTVAVLKQIKLDDSRIRIFEIEHGGVSKARNYGIDKARGEYLFFVDSDDRLVCDYLEDFMNEDLALDYVSSGYLVLDDGAITEVKRGSELFEIQFVKENLLKISNRLKYSFVWGTRYKKSIIDENGIRFDQDESVGEDIDFNLKYLNCCNYIKSIDSCKYIYKSTANSTMQQFQPERWNQYVSECLRLERFSDNVESLTLRWWYLELSLDYYFKWYRSGKITKKSLQSLLVQITSSNFYSEINKMVYDNGTKDMKLFLALLRIGIAFPLFLNFFSKKYRLDW